MTNFIEDACIIKAEAWTGSGDLRDSYEKWCTKSGESPVSAHVMAKLLTARGFVKARNYANGRGWQGLGLLEKPGA